MNTAKIVAITQPTIDNVNTADEFIAYCARVSNPSNQNNTETASKLIKYLIKNSHWSPFEMVSLTMEIVTTRDIARQILRHRSFSFQEFSQRYADPTKDLGFVTRDARLQDYKNRQNSIETDNESLVLDWFHFQEMLKQQAQGLYEWAINSGIAKEQARAVLPEGLTVSKMYMAGTLRSWIHYCDLRCDNGTQKEHREVANSAKQQLIEKFPSIKEYFEDHDD